ncbi:MAG TPA: hypothetical protein VK966_05880 [Longimicrobiales bacterium]|nr:hypothetical protein [Longimicrobiales bacterium]
MKSGRKGLPLIRLALLLACLLGSLTLVIWRQSRALELLRDLEAVRQERVLEEARRAGYARRMEELESRARVSQAARDRFEMRVPSGGELVILRLQDAVRPAYAAVEGPGEAVGERGGG